MHSFRPHLLEAGYPDGPTLEPLLEFADSYLKRGHDDVRYLLKRIRKEFGPPPPALAMRDQPAPLSQAIRAETAEEQDNLHQTCRKITELLHSPVVERGTLMPDACVAGTETASLPVGGVVATQNALIPSAHSADICCSLFATFYQGDLETSQELDHLQKVTRFGPGGRPREDWLDHPVLHEPVWNNPFLNGLQDKARMHLADQGDGNHFASLGEGTLQSSLLEKAGHGELAAALGPDSWRALVTHHGSRGLGASVFKRGLAAAVKHTHALNAQIPEAACWLDAQSELGQSYWEALQYVARWTRTNHELIHDRFLKVTGSTPLAQLGNEHNFVWRRGSLFLHGKGATPAWPDEDGRPRLGLIPLNMCEPILLVLGNDNSEHLSFAPHGAGRNLSRSALIRKIRKDKASRDPKHFARLLKENTRGTEVRWFSEKPDLTETAIAYKNAATIRQQLEEFDLATIAAEIHPRGCLMAGQSKSWKELKAEHLTPKQKRQLDHRAKRRSEKQRGWEDDDW